MLNNKETLLIQHLLENRSDYTTSMALAAYMSCSDRTIRTYIKSITDTLDTIEGVQLISKQGKGYQLHFSDETVYQSFKKQFGQQEKVFNPNTQQDIIDRQSYILNKLLLEQENLFLDDLAEELYVSRSTLSADFKKIRKDLSAYGLTVESKPNKGVYVEGPEQAIRRFIMDYFFNSSFLQTLYQYVGEELIYGKINFEALTVIVLDECREAGLKLSDFVIQNLVVHIALAIRRLAEGFRISAVEGELVKPDSREYLAAKNILEIIALSTRLEFPKEEVSYVTLHLMSKGQVSQDETGNYREQIRIELLKSLEDLAQGEWANLHQDFQFLEGVLTHLATLYLRLANHIVLGNPLLDDIFKNYRSAFDLAQEVLKAMPSFAHYDLSDDEIAYVALHFMAAKERLKEDQKYNVLVICATGYGSAQLLRSRIKHELRNQVNIVDVVGYYELTNDKLKGIDFIISSIDLSNVIFNIPVFTTSVFLKEEELKEIRQQIEGLAGKGLSKPSGQQMETLDAESLFDSYFSSDYFFRYDEASVTKEEVLNDLTQGLSLGEGAGFADRLLDLMTQREKLSSVLFSETIAVPHPIKPVASDLKIGVAIVPQGFSWEEGVDKIRLVFLPAISQSDNKGLSQITRALVDLVDKPHRQEAFLACKTFAAFRALMIEEIRGE